MDLKTYLVAAQRDVDEEYTVDADQKQDGAVAVDADVDDETVQKQCDGEVDMCDEVVDAGVSVNV